MAAWKPGDRVRHQTFGAGTVLDADDQHITVHFDTPGRKKLASSMVTLTASSEPEPHRGSSVTWPSAAPRTPAPQLRPVAVTRDAPASVEQLMEVARRTVGDEASLNEFVSRMRKDLPGPNHHYVGVLSGMRVQQFQNWLYEMNPQHQLTDAQLLAVFRVEFPLAGAELFTGDVTAGLRHLRSMRADYNRTGHNGPTPQARRMPPSVSYGTF
jgi:hypothetical protein